MTFVNRQTVRQILGICTFSILLLWSLCFPDASGPAWRVIFNILRPFLYGFCITYLMNLIIRRLEAIPRKRGPMPRGVSLTLTVLILVLLLVLTLGLIIPGMIHTGQVLVQSLPGAFEQVKYWVVTQLERFPEAQAFLEGQSLNLESMQETLVSAIRDNLGGMVGNIAGAASGTLQVIVNLAMGFSIALMVLPMKERICQAFRALAADRLKEEKAGLLFRHGALLDEKFSRYFAAQVTEAVLMGLMTFLLMALLSIPYALELSIFSGVMYLIPTFGLPAAMVLGAAMILAVEPVRALWYLLTVLGVQLLLMYLVHPLLVERKLELPGPMQFVAILLFGTSFGIGGVILAVPLSSYLYDLLLKKYVVDTGTGRKK